MCFATNPGLHSEFNLDKFSKMAAFSLEEEDGFMVVSQSQQVHNFGSQENGILGNPSDFQLPVHSVIEPIQ